MRGTCQVIAIGNDPVRSAGHDQGVTPGAAGHGGDDHGHAAPAQGPSAQAVKMVQPLALVMLTPPATSRAAGLATVEALHLVAAFGASRPVLVRVEGRGSWLATGVDALADPGINRG